MVLCVVPKQKRKGEPCKGGRMNIIDITPKQSKVERKIRLAPYCRVSSDSEDQRHSFATQIRYYSEYTQKHPEYELVDIYADEGLTGTEMEKRDDFLRLIRDCRKGLIDCVMTKSVSRFARNTIELLETLRLLKELGVSVYFEEQGIDTEKLNMEMIVTFPGMAAQQESETISGNVRWGIQKRMESAEYNCTFTPYGYKRIDGEMVIDETEAKIVRRVFDLYLQGMGMQAIANLLNDKNVPRRYGYTKWYQTAIKYILTNERYMGDALLQKYYTTDLPYRQKRNKGERTQYYVENSNPAIVSQEVYEKVQELISSKRNGQCQRRVHTLAGKLRCPECGATFRRQVWAGNITWFCSKKASRATQCTSIRVRENMVFETFIDMLYKLKKNQRQIIGSLIQQIGFLQSRTSGHQDRIQQIDRDLADLAAKNLVVTRLHTNGIISVADYSAQTTEIASRIDELRKERKVKMVEDEDEALEELRELDEILSEYKPNSYFDEELFGQIVKKMIIDDNAHITFCLLGGLKLTEQIKEKGRCKTA